MTTNEHNQKYLKRMQNGYKTIATGKGTAGVNWQLQIPKRGAVIWKRQANE